MSMTADGAQRRFGGSANYLNGGYLKGAEKFGHKKSTFLNRFLCALSGLSGDLVKCDLSGSSDWGEKRVRSARGG